MGIGEDLIDIILNDDNIDDSTKVDMDDLLEFLEGEDN
jgi:hypothetical protein